MKDVLFKEKQKMRNAFIFLPIVLILIIFLYATVQQVLLKEPFGNNPAPNWSLILIIVLLVSILLLFFQANLSTEISKEGISFRYFPFHIKENKLSWNDIEKCYLRQYKPIIEFGGWGIRYGFKGKAYNVYGNMGLQLELKNGRRILIGTQNPEGMQAALDIMFQNSGKII